VQEGRKQKRPFVLAVGPRSDWGWEGSEEYTGEKENGVPRGCGVLGVARGAWGSEGKGREVSLTSFIKLRTKFNANFQNLPFPFVKN
jgi:hypothetical protein